MRTPQEDILGLFLENDVSFTLKHIDKVRAEWFDIALYKRVFKAIVEISAKGTAPNILAVTQLLKDRAQFQKGDVAKVASLPTGSYRGALYIKSIISELKTEYQKRSTSLTVQKLQRGIVEDTFTPSMCLEEIEKLKGVITEKEQKEELIGEVVEKIVHKHNQAKEGKLEGLELGYHNLSEKLLLEPVDVLIVAARPAMGKTAFGVSTLCRLLFQEGKTVPYFSLEMSKEQIVRRIIAHLARIDSRKIRYGKCSEKEVKLIQSIGTRPEFDNLHIYEGSHTITDISRILTKLNHEKPIDLFIVDYLQKITATKGRTEFEKTTANSNDLKYLVQNIEIPCLALAQVKRADGGKIKRPTLSDLRGSGDIEQDASIVAFLHRPEYHGEKQTDEGEDTAGLGEFIIAKNREGTTGIYKFHVDLTTSNWDPHTKGKKTSKNKEEEKPDELPF